MDISTLAYWIEEAEVSESLLSTGEKLMELRFNGCNLNWDYSSPWPDMVNIIDLDGNMERIQLEAVRVSSASPALSAYEFSLCPVPKTQAPFFLTNRDEAKINRSTVRVAEVSLQPIQACITDSGDLGVLRPSTDFDECVRELLVFGQSSKVEITQVVLAESGEVCHIDHVPDPPHEKSVGKKGLKAFQVVMFILLALYGFLVIFGSENSDKFIGITNTGWLIKSAYFISKSAIIGYLSITLSLGALVYSFWASSIEHLTKVYLLVKTPFLALHSLSCVYLIRYGVVALNDGSIIAYDSSDIVPSMIQEIVLNPPLILLPLLICLRIVRHG